MSSIKYKTIIYPIAQNDFLDIKDYFENNLKTSPNNLFEKFYKSLDLLESNPLIHPLLTDTYLRELGYRMYPIDNFLVFYVIEKHEIQIHRFLYGKRNYLQILDIAAPR
jgi:addiction module RelE/StbE family toxin